MTSTVSITTKITSVESLQKPTSLPFLVMHGVCFKTELVNIRGHIGIHKTARFWQVAASYTLHIDSSLKGCQFDPTVGAASSEDNFGYYGTTNPKFTCTMNGDSTTQWWFGSYQ